MIYIKTKRGYNLSPDELITSVLNKFETLRKDNKWNSMSPEQEQIISLASVVEKLKDDNLNLSKIFKYSPPGKGKYKIKVKSKGNNPPGKQSQYVKGKEEWKNQ